MKTKKRNNKVLLVILLVAILLIGVFGGLIIKKHFKNIDFFKPIHLGLKEDYIDVDENYVFTDYNDFKDKTASDVLKKGDFNSNNYALVELIFDGCAEDDIQIQGYNLADDTITFNYTYEAGCGGCAALYDYYLIPIDKNSNGIKINLDGKARNNPDCDPTVSYKPMIYLYPEEKTDVTIKLGYPELLTTTYPKYINSWEVTAYPNGNLVDKNGKSYYGLYWEGYNQIETNFEDGFVIKKEDTILFLEEKLSILGLNEREANEFIVYWLPILEQNDYNLIRFESLEEINKQMPLEINPKPDSIIRVLMKFKPLDKMINIKEQDLIPSSRYGFTVVEWGGTKVD